jgi:hypothetical protein
MIRTFEKQYMLDTLKPHYERAREKHEQNTKSSFAQAMSGMNLPSWVIRTIALYDGIKTNRFQKATDVTQYVQTIQTAKF